MRFVARHGAFAALVAVAGILRLAYLDAIPGPAGDEGNWTSWALDLHRGRAVEMPAEASFVSLSFARLIALSFDVFGPGFAAARVVNAFATLVAVVAVHAALRALDRPRAALAAAAFLALHPWCVAWSRTAAVPYALALASSTAGAAAFCVGLERKDVRAIAVGIVLVALGAHVSPLTLVSAVACGAMTLGADHRWVLRSPATYVALAVGGLVAVTPILGAVAATNAVAPPERAIPFAGRLLRFAHMIGTGLAGEATLRHFGNAAIAFAPASFLAVVPLAAIGAAARRAANGSITIVGRLGLVWLGLGVVLVPFVLSAGRNWYLPDIDRERYLFALLPGVAFLVGDLVESTDRFPRIASFGFVSLVAIATLRLAVDAMHGGGPDRGADVFAGGGAYRGFRSSLDHRAPAELVADVIARELPRGSGVVLAEASLRPVSFALLRRHPPGRSGHPAYFFAEAEYYPDPYTHTGSLAFVVYARSMFPDDGPTSIDGARRNEELRHRMITDYAGLRRIASVRQPNGDPLLEVFRAERPERPW